jgi:tetratricopeptide (TPR) repeat protein
MRRRTKTAEFPRPGVAHGLLPSFEDRSKCLASLSNEWHSEQHSPMKVRLAIALTSITLASAAPAGADARTEAKAQVEFGISVAQRGLWREAIYRWERAIEIDPTYAAAYNDLAIAYEHEGQLEKARKAYEEALELDPDNAQVRQNYELFKEINDRTGSSKEKP